MRILWIVNMLLPDAAEYLQVQTSPSGSWMVDLSHQLSERDDITLAVACIYGDKFQKLEVNNITYFLLPGNGKNMLFYTAKYERLWQQIDLEFKPDLVHIHGTEYSHGLSFLRSCPNVKSIISLQGVLNRIKDVDLGEIPMTTFLKYRTFREMTHFNGPIEQHFLNRKNAKYEREMLQRTQYVNGVNTWDLSIAQVINPNLKAFQLEYNLRKEMYDESKWSFAEVELHSIFTNPGGTPLKGLHQLIKAVGILKQKYPDIKLKVPGMGKNGVLEANSSYAKYLAALIKELDLSENIIFMGRQTAKQMCENIRKAHVVVVPSAIEGTSLILREAMFIGCPVVASFRGGMADFVADKIDGFLYDYQEYPYLAQRLNELFENENLCKSFSERAIRKAEKAHNRLYNTNKILEIYNEINCG